MSRRFILTIHRQLHGKEDSTAQFLFRHAVRELRNVDPLPGFVDSRGVLRHSCAYLLTVAFATIQSIAAEARLHIVELRGPAYQRGLTHGKQLQSEIQRLVTLWKADLKQNFGRDADKLIAAFLKETSFKLAIEATAPELLEEVRGIAAGAQVPFDTMYAFQLVDELWVNAREISKRLAVEHCTSLGAARAGTNSAWIAQNVDVESFRHGFQTLLHIRGSAGEPEQYVFSFAGYIGANGLNARSIGICANAMPQLRHARTGLPVAFVIRHMLKQTNAAEAARWLQTVQHATSQNYILGTGDSVYDFECSAGKVVRYMPRADGALVYHTNHPLTNDNWDAEFLAQVRRVDPEGLAAGSTGARFNALEARLKGREGGLDFSMIAGILRSRDSEQFPICVPLKSGSGAFTFGSTIMRLGPEPELHVSAGPPDVNPYTVFRFSR
jgi:isopenicillin-N N-acyltransferase-like protein